MFHGLKEVKVAKVQGDINMTELNDKINGLLNEGWTLLDISAHAPETLPGQYSKNNYFIYHFGKFEN